MSKPTIAVDIDEVIFPMVDSLIDYVEKEHKVTLSADSFETYRLEDLWPEGTEEGRIVFDTYFRREKLEVAPLKGAKEALEKLSKKYNLILVTYRAIEVEDVTKSWLVHNFGELIKDLHMLGSDQEGFEYRSKGEVCKELGVEWLIDDQVPNVISAHQAGIKALLFGDYAWNQSDDLLGEVIRAKNWQEVLEILL